MSLLLFFMALACLRRFCKKVDANAKPKGQKSTTMFMVELKNYAKEDNQTKLSYRCYEITRQHPKGIEVGLKCAKITFKR